MIDKELPKGCSKNTEGEEDVVEGGVQSLDLVANIFPPSVSHLSSRGLDPLSRSLPLHPNGHRSCAVHPRRGVGCSEEHCQQVGEHLDESHHESKDADVNEVGDHHRRDVEGDLVKDCSQVFSPAKWVSAIIYRKRQLVPVISNHKSVASKRSSPQQIPPARLPREWVGEHWGGPLELLPLQVQLLVVLADFSGGGRKVFAESNLCPESRI